jgi:hypothetical protein
VVSWSRHGGEVNGDGIGNMVTTVSFVVMDRRARRHRPHPPISVSDEDTA